MSVIFLCIDVRGYVEMIECCLMPNEQFFYLYYGENIQWDDTDISFICTK